MKLLKNSQNFGFWISKILLAKNRSRVGDLPGAKFG
jgi:hypothetical protein